MCAVQLDNKTLFRKTNCQTDRNYIKSGLAQDVFLQKPSSASYLLTPDRRKTLVFSSKIQETCLQGGPPGASTGSRFATIPSPVIRYLINDFGKIVGYLTLSPQANALVANLLKLNPPSSKYSGTCPLAKASLSRRQQSITRYDRLNKQAVWRLKPFPLCSKSQKTPAGLCPSYPHRGRMIAFATAVRSGPSALRGPIDSSFAIFINALHIKQPYPRFR